MIKNSLGRVLFITIASLVFVSIVDVDALSVVTSEAKITRAIATEWFVKDENDEGSQIINAIDSTGQLQLYCADRSNESWNPVELQRETDPMDYAYSYILQNAYPNVSNLFGTNTVMSTCADSTQSLSTDKTAAMNLWITQSAIWGYKENSYKDNAVSLSLKYSQSSATVICDNPKIGDTNINGSNLWSEYVQKLIDAAKNAVDPATSVVNFTFEKGWTADGDIYETNLIKPVVSAPDANYTTIALALVDAPEGTKVYKKGGEELTGNMSITAGEEIYITVPSDKAKKAPKFTLNATTNISYYAAYKYVDNTSNSQPTVLLNPATKDVAGALELSIAPDTASSISAAMYFIGLLILLSGAGIIYANVRPRKEEI